MATRWGGWYWHLGLASFLGMGGALASFGNSALAQITPDGTLGAESSIVTPTNIDGLPTQQIDGGATRGANLFHSFEQFSVPMGGAAYFNNAPNIQNIISRVTGSSVSNIEGLIKAKGNANLFLINPNGIMFGPNASLNIGGSFIASTASSLNFKDGTQFSATTPQATPLLTTSVPMGLQFGGNPKSITNRSQAIMIDPNGTKNIIGLRVESGKTLALVGGEVSLDGGSLKALNGRVELGGLAEAGTVELAWNVDGNPLSLVFPNGIARADVSLNNNPTKETAINVRGATGRGSIAITAHNLNVGDKSGAGKIVLRAGIANPKPREGIANTTSSDNRAASVINIDSTGDVNLTKNSFISNSVETEAMGKGGEIIITTRSLTLTNGAVIENTIRGKGTEGSVTTIKATHTVYLDRGHVFSSVKEENPTGSSGDINIETGTLQLTNGATIDGNTFTIDGNTFTFGQGKAGSLTLNVDNLLLLRNNSRITSSANTDKKGSVNGGKITITTPFLVAVPNENSDIAANAFGGSGGNININAYYGIFGIESRKHETPQSDIIANSDFGFNGVVNIIKPDIDPSRGLAILPVQVVDASVLIASSACGANRRQGQSKFIITGRGGLPLRPGDAHISHYPTGSVRPIPSSSSSIDSTISVEASDPATNSTSETVATPIVEATSWVFNNNGEVTLIASVPSTALNIPWLTPATCQAVKQ